MPTYNEQLRDPRWQRKRLEALSASDWQCSRCHNDRRTLHVHHLEYRPVPPWEYALSELEVLCDKCHREVHGFLLGKGRFDPRRPYTRTEIQKVLGGPAIGFLPMHKGHVVCGCFRRKYNPDAPDILLPGNLQRIIEPAERFCRQSFPIPIFICETKGDEWFYRGDYEVSSWTENPKEIAIHNQRAGHNFVSRVIFLRSHNK
jgi:hypothetical protein